MLKTTTLLAVWLWMSVGQSPANLLQNPEADFNVDWISRGEASVEPCGDDPCFVLRNHAQFRQTVALPDHSEGRYLVMIGAGSSERVNPQGDIMEMPYLYGKLATADGTRYLAYLQGQQLRAHRVRQNEWVKMSGIFKIPAGARRLVFDLSQASRNGAVRTGAAARFDNVGVYVFDSEPDAKRFVAAWTGSRLPATIPTGM